MLPVREELWRPQVISALAISSPVLLSRFLFRGLCLSSQRKGDLDREEQEKRMRVLSVVPF